MVKKIYWAAIPLLIAFGYTLSLQPYEPARSFIIYGGIYILSCLGLAAFTSLELVTKDYIGIALLLIGVALLL